MMMQRMTKIIPRSKYSIPGLIEQFRIAAEARNAMIKAGGTDNGGAIHSAARVLDILALRVKYNTAGHIRSVRNNGAAEFSVKAKAAHRRGQPILIEHVAPTREFTCKAIVVVTKYKSDEPLLRFIKKHYRLVHLTPEETIKLNRQNRSKMDPQRLEKAGIRMTKGLAASPSKRQ
jgi:hypothetical protein